MRSPYWASRDGRVTLYHGDSLEVLPTLATDSAQMVCTDPPYAEQTHQGARTGNPRSSKKLVTFASLTADDIRARFAEAGRVASRWLVATMEFRHVAALEVSPPDGYMFIRAGCGRSPSACRSSRAIDLGRDGRRSHSCIARDLAGCGGAEAADHRYGITCQSATRSTQRRSRSHSCVISSRCFPTRETPSSIRSADRGRRSSRRSNADAGRSESTSARTRYASPALAARP